MPERPLDAVAGNINPGVHVSWAEAVRAVPDIAAAEAVRIADELAAALRKKAALEKNLLYREDVERDALVDLGEAIERFNQEEHDPARKYVCRAMNTLQGKPRMQGGGE